MLLFLLVLVFFGPLVLLEGGSILIEALNDTLRDCSRNKEKEEAR